MANQPSPSDLVRHETTLQKIDSEATAVKKFLHLTDDEWMCLPNQLWEDMGSPDEITVIVKPGNKLNETG